MVPTVASGVIALLRTGKITQFGVQSSTAFTKPHLSLHDVVDAAANGKR